MQGNFIIKTLAAAMIGCLSLAAHASISSNSTDGIVAIVNDEIILKSELGQAAQIVADEMKKRGTVATSEQVQAVALNELIDEKLQLGLINRAGMVVNDAIINQQLLQIAQSQGLSSLAELQSTLDGKQAGSYAALRQGLIQDASMSALWQSQVQSRVRISDEQVNAFLKSPEAARLNQSQYQLLHIRVPYLNHTASEQNYQQALTVAKQVKSALDNGKTLDQTLKTNQTKLTGELQGVDTGLINANALPANIATEVDKLAIGQTSLPLVGADGIDVIKLVDKKEQARILASEWNTSHILARVDDNQSSDMAEQKINALYQELQKGGDFAMLAATYSDDTGSAAQHGGLGWVNEGEMVAEFETVMKNTARGDYSTPFRSQFGWHILKVNDIRQKDVTEQYRRNAAREYLFTRQAPQAQEDWLQELRSGAYIKIYE
ncbi:peptidylprolyl isomerase [Moraxella marmotae]|uniref:peptidylprolyl isomerase n=1 Tax=Moraxella marmotae TaxID=3344520 RepID=UPI0035F3D6D0